MRQGVRKKGKQFYPNVSGILMSKVNVLFRAYLTATGEADAEA